MCIHFLFQTNKSRYADIQQHSFYCDLKQNTKSNVQTNARISLLSMCARPISITVYVSISCGYCVRTEDSCSSEQIKHFILFVSVFGSLFWLLQREQFYHGIWCVLRRTNKIFKPQLIQFVSRQERKKKSAKHKVLPETTRKYLFTVDRTGVWNSFY